MKNSLVAAAVLFVSTLNLSSNANATPLTYAGYTLDEQANVVTGGGLEWLQWDVTKGKSINDALYAHQHSGGWRLASNADIANLFNNFGVCGHTFSDAEDHVSGCSAPWDAAELSNDPHKMFNWMFGYTDQYSKYSRALYGSDDDGDGLYKMAHIQDDYHMNIYNTTAYYGDWVLVGSDQYSKVFRESFIGVALVRDAAEAPTPATLALFAAGVIGLTAVRRRKVSGTLFKDHSTTC